MSYSWLSQIQYATETHHIRELFLKYFPFIQESEVQNAFFERIEFLRNRSANAQMVRDLEDLKDDIELEIEHGSMLKNVGMKKIMKSDQESEPESHYYSALESKRSKLQELNVVDGLLKDDEDLSSKKGLWSKVERELTLKVLKDCNGNRTQTARVLGISLRTLRNKLEFYEKLSKGLDTSGYMERRVKLIDQGTIHGIRSKSNTENDGSECH